LKGGATSAEEAKFVPFGGGRRFCAGYNLAINEVYLLLSNLAYYFEFSAPDGPDSVDLTEVFGLTLQPTQQNLIAKPRNLCSKVFP
jgi:cytochrome P450